MTETETPTGPQKAQKNRLAISPETQVVVRLGLLASAAVALVFGTIFVWQIKRTGEDALEAIRALRSDYSGLAEEHRELWWHYRTTARGLRDTTNP